MMTLLLLLLRKTIFGGISFPWQTLYCAAAICPAARLFCCDLYKSRSISTARKALWLPLQW
jgi:hypothetical protein